MVTCAFNRSTQERQMELCEFKVSLGNKVSSKTAEYYKEKSYLNLYAQLYPSPHPKNPIIYG